MSNPTEVGGYSRGRVSDAPMRAKELAIPNAMALLDKQVGELLVVIDTLDKRLSPMLRKEPSACAKENGMGPGGNCDHAAGIEEQSYRVSSARQRLERLMDLLEI